MTVTCALSRPTRAFSLGLLAAANVEQALAVITQTRSSLFPQVGYSVAIARRTLGTYAESVRLYQLQFKYGQTSQMTVSQAQSQYETAAAQIPQAEQSLFPAELTLAAVRASVFTSAANTYKAMGGGWVTEADKLTGTAMPGVNAPPGLPPLF